MEDEPELALSDEYIEEPVKSVAENPKDIFSMIVGEELDEEVKRLQVVFKEMLKDQLPEEKVEPPKLVEEQPKQKRKWF